jgi:LysM repeat protein
MKLYLSFVALLFSIAVFCAPSDSVGVETKGGRSYILHKVEAGETLYALSKRYNSSVSSIERSNTLKSGLSVGQVLWVPTSYKPEEALEDLTYHAVAPGQTLYAISRLYTVSVGDIKKWNDLSSNELSVGQKIIVKKGIPQDVLDQNKSIDAVEIKQEVKKVDTIKNERVVEVEVKKEVPIVKKKKKSSYNPQMQIGQVVLGTEKPLDYRFSYCLHPTAPIGTIIVLTCKFNDRVILVKVIGNVGMEEGVILKANKSVFDSLNIVNESFEAEVTYLD